jgi:O-succinylbenzoate synthase
MMRTVHVVGGELLLLDVPMVRPFDAASSSTTSRRVVLLRLDGADGEVGWGECAALPAPGYTAEWADGAFDALTSALPSIVGTTPTPETADVEGGGAGRASTWAPAAGLGAMARATVAMALLDAELRAAGESFQAGFGATRATVDSGVSVGFAPNLEALLDEVGGYVDAGYRRVKLKIAPGRDLDVVAAVRAQHPGVPLQVDGNGAYSTSDADHLAGLDTFDLLLLEQPLGEDDLAGHAALAERLETPICLDESLTSVAATAAALDAGACEIVNLKPGRVGGYLEAVRIHDLCVARGVPLWLGGMLETAVARAANLRLAALPGFTLPPDLSASDRYFPEDVAAPITLGADGRIAVPGGPGLSAAPDPDALDRFAVARRRL